MSTVSHGETPAITLRATYDCVFWPDPEDEDPARWGGYCDPQNPWGTTDDEYDPLAPDYDPEDEPITLTERDFDDLDELVTFVRDFPGAVWDVVHDCDPRHNYRTGVSTTVTLHVDGPIAVDVLNAAYPGATYNSRGAQLLRSVTGRSPVVWSPETGWRL